MVGSSDASPLHGTEQDTSGDEASRGNCKHLHQVQKLKKRKNKERRKKVGGKAAKKREEHFLRDFKRENAEMEKEVDDFKSKAAEMNQQMMTKLSNVKNKIANQEILVDNLLQEPLVQQQLMLGANQLEVLLLGNIGLNQCNSDGIGELKDRVMMLGMRIDVLCRLFLK